MSESAASFSMVFTSEAAARASEVRARTRDMILECVEARGCLFVGAAQNALLECALRPMISVLRVAARHVVDGPTARSLAYGAVEVKLGRSGSPRAAEN